MKKFIDLFIMLFVYIFYFPFMVLPYGACLFLGRLLAFVLYPVAGKHRSIAEENIKHAFPEMTEAQRKDLVRRHFRHLGYLVGDSFYAPRINKQWMDKYLVYDGDSMEIENRTLAEKIGVVMLSGHLGTWEILVHMVGHRWNGAGIYKKLRNTYMDGWYRRMREASGIRMIPMEEASAVVKELKNGQWVGFGADQNAGKAGIFVNFFNRPASTFQGPALMSYLTGAKILHYAVVRSPDGKIHVRVNDIGIASKKDFPDRETAIRVFTEKWTQSLEREARLFPEQYFWVHRRWRTRPGDFPENTPKPAV